MAHPLIMIHPHSAVPIYRQIESQLRHHILAGRIAPGEAIPSVRELSASLSINPITVSKAYSILEQSQLLEMRRGVGLFVADRTSSFYSGEREKRLQEIVSKFGEESRELQATWVEVRKLLQNEFKAHQKNLRGK